MNPSTALATVLVDELIAGGVTDVVLAPGSRSAPLAFAVRAADAAGRVRLHVRVDERGAGFLALGMAQASGRPVAVITTSGTAVANLHPSVIEAHLTGVPLIVLSADRPPRLRGVGANQVIDQLTVFGPGVLRFRHEFALPTTAPGQNGYWRGQVCRALAAARGAFSGGLPGPVQLNVPFDVPLIPDDDSGECDVIRAGSESGSSWSEPLIGRQGPYTAIAPAAPGYAVPLPEPDERCLFVADLTHPLAAAVADAGYLVVSEAGGLGGAGVLSAGMHLLADAEFLANHRPDRVIVLGRPTLFRTVNALLANASVAVDVVDRSSRFTDLTGNVRMVAPMLAPLPGDTVSLDARRADGPTGSGPARAWVAAWRAAEATVSTAIAGVFSAPSERTSASSASVARALGAAVPAPSALVVGSSQPPRDLARFTAARSGVRMLANRGAAGIDGIVSTAIGTALAGGAVAGDALRPTYALMGDLTFLHDVTALAIGPHEPRPDLTIVVANNDGGGIFATLEQGAPEHAAAFERIFGTPTGAQIAQLAEGLGAEHVLATGIDELTAEVGRQPDGLLVVEVPVTRTDLRSFDRRIAETVREALATLAS